MQLSKGGKAICLLFAVGVVAQQFSRQATDSPSQEAQAAKSVVTSTPTVTPSATDLPSQEAQAAKSVVTSTPTVTPSATADQLTQITDKLRTLCPEQSPKLLKAGVEMYTSLNGLDYGADAERQLKNIDWLTICHSPDIAVKPPKMSEDVHKACVESVGLMRSNFADEFNDQPIVKYFYLTRYKVDRICGTY
jgi:hypothetical protein